MAEETAVLYVHRQDAKAVKSCLEREVLLDKRFRMAPVVVDGGGASITVDYCVDSRQDGDNNDGPSLDRIKNCIAIPVTEGCAELIRQYYLNRSDINQSPIECDTRSEEPSSQHDNAIKAESRSNAVIDGNVDTSWIGSMHIVGFGMYTCPFSTSMLGNNNKGRRTACKTKQKKNIKKISSNNGDNGCLVEEKKSHPLTHVQYALIETLNAWLDNNAENDDDRGLDIEGMVRSLGVQTCPKKLEIMGDDRTLVIPRYSLFVRSQQTYAAGGKEGTKCNIRGPKKESSEFREFLVKAIRESKQRNGNEQNQATNSTEDGQLETYESSAIDEIQSQLWKTLSNVYSSPRIVRRGDIDPESGVRESGHRILLPVPQPSSDGSTINGDRNRGFLPTNTGPKSPGWITATEHGIRQSFDLTRVMFSRGNVTEKKRFGMMVQPDECVLDMYAGIGYYTLPALIHGGACHVTACEWNKNALYALRCNLKQNGVEDKTTVLEGDCRVSLKKLIDQSNCSGNDAMHGSTAAGYSFTQFDRISLGLLPSSEGGWASAVSCLRKSTGGWLHVHANVPTMERQNFAHWLCRSLAGLAAEHHQEESNTGKNWVAVCTHVEKVKSFAPKVDHVVADVFVGPCGSHKAPSLKGEECSTGVVDSSGHFTQTPLDVSPPSCALNTEGILHQEWMR